MDTESPSLADLVASSPAGPHGPRALLAVLEGHGAAVDAAAAGAVVDAGAAAGRAAGQAHPAAPATGGNKQPFNRAFTKQTTAQILHCKSYLHLNPFCPTLSSRVVILYLKLQITGVWNFFQLLFI